MIKKFDFVLLPPDGFHINFQDLHYLKIKNFQLIEKHIYNMSKFQKKKMIIKYRTEFQKENFPCKSEYKVGYGNLLDLCHEKTEIIGPCGSSMLKVLKSNLNYYSYDFEKRYSDKRIERNKFNAILHVANTVPELIKNIKNKKIYKKNLNYKSLLFSDGKSLKDLVSDIINK